MYQTTLHGPYSLNYSAPSQRSVDRPLLHDDRNNHTSLCDSDKYLRKERTKMETHTNRRRIPNQGVNKWLFIIQ